MIPFENPDMHSDLEANGSRLAFILNFPWQTAAFKSEGAMIMGKVLEVEFFKVRQGSQRHRVHTRSLMKIGTSSVSF
jgi:hypothetical protein